MARQALKQAEQQDGQDACSTYPNGSKRYKLVPARCVRAVLNPNPIPPIHWNIQDEQLVSTEARVSYIVLQDVQSCRM